MTNGELLEGCFFELAGSENNHVEGAPASIDDQLGLLLLRGLVSGHSLWVSWVLKPLSSMLLTQDRGLLRRRALWLGAYVRGAP